MRYMTIGNGMTTHIAYTLGEGDDQRLTGSLCDRSAYQSKRVRFVEATDSNCSRCKKVLASDDKASGNTNV